LKVLLEVLTCAQVVGQPRNYDSLKNFSRLLQTNYVHDLTVNKMSIWLGDTLRTYFSFVVVAFFLIFVFVDGVLQEIGNRALKQNVGRSLV